MNFSILRYNFHSGLVSRLVIGKNNIKLSSITTGITIGTFDGLHRGHQQLICELNSKLSESTAERSYSVLMSLYPHPRYIISPNNKLNNSIHDYSRLITPARARFGIAGSLNLDELCLLRFNKHFASLSAYDFIKKIIVEPFLPKYVVVGYDWSFGRNKEGNVSILKELGQKFGFETIVVDQVSDNDSKIGASHIRKFLFEGNISSANKLLGYKFNITGKVVMGDGRGSRIGIPTANIHSVRQFLPMNGVYQTEVEIDDKLYPSITNIGFRPTFKKTAEYPVIETHILDTNINVYGKYVKLFFINRIRSEMKFSSAEELIAQIQKDIITVKSMFDFN